MERYEKQIQAVVKSLKSELYIWLAALILLAVMGIFFGPHIPKFEPSLTIALQSALLLLMLGGLPGVFIWFRNRMRVLANVEDVELRLIHYETYSRIRQAAFFVFGLLVLFMHVFTNMKGAPMLFLVVVVLGLFILPSRGRVIMEASLIKPEEEAEKNEEDMGSE